MRTSVSLPAFSIPALPDRHIGSFMGIIVNIRTLEKTCRYKWHANVAAMEVS